MDYQLWYVELENYEPEDEISKMAKTLADFLKNDRWVKKVENHWFI